MQRRRVLGFVGLALVGFGCHDHSETTGNPALADVVYEGGTNDEALETLLGAQAVSDPQQAAALTQPGDGAMVAASPPAAFTWAAAAAACPKCGELRHALLLGSVRALFGHGTPLNGPAHFVVFGASGSPELVRVFTTLDSYTPDETHWQKLVAAGAPIEVAITTGVFDNNLLLSDGGPFAGPTVRFTITP